MTLIVDASVAFKWLLDEPGSTEALRLLGSDDHLYVPSLIAAEIRNALATRVRKKTITVEEARNAARELEEARLLLIPIESLAVAAFELALELEHPVYDCFYLAAAIARDCRLVTADARFHDVVRRRIPHSASIALLGH